MWSPFGGSADGELVGFTGPASALVEVPGGDGKPPRTALVESELPLRGADGSTPVDLGLERVGGAYKPRNPVAPVELPADAADAVSLPGAGVSVRAARSAEAPSEVEGKLFYANAEGPERDLDLVLSPDPLGFNAEWQLRSEESPEQLALDFEPPPGATLELDERTGGAAVVQRGRKLVRVLPPSTVDSDGESVPSSYAVEGSRLLVRVEHRAGDYRYPLHTDPMVQDLFQRNIGGHWDGTCIDWRANGWQFFASNASKYYYGHYNEGGGECGVYIQTKDTANGQIYTNNDWAEWIWQAPGGTAGDAFLRRADFHLSHQPWWTCIIEGVWSYQQWAWNTGSWGHPPGYYPARGPSPWWGRQGTAWEQSQPTYRGDSCAAHNHNTKAHEPTISTWASKGNAAVAMIENGAGANPGRVARMELVGALMFEDDFTAPDISVAHTGLPAGWVHRAAPTITMNAADDGLGSKGFILWLPRAGGGVTTQAYNHPCNGSRSYRCPATWNPYSTYRSISKAFAYTSDQMPEGTVESAAQAYDITEKSSYGTWKLKVDRSLPTDLTPTGGPSRLSGSLWEQRGDFITGDSYTLGVDARDDFSGVESISYAVHRGDADGPGGNPDGPVVDTGDEAGRTARNPTCHPQNGCSTDFPSSPPGEPRRPHTFEVDTSRLAEDGRYTVEVVVKDQVAGDATYGEQHTRREFFAIEVDRKAPEISASHDGLRTWMRDDELVSSTVTGNDQGGSGLKRFRLAFPGGAPDERTRSCGGIGAGRCRTTDSETFSYRTDRERFPGDGAQEVEATVEDAVGRSHSARWSVNVDRAAPRVKLSGGLRSLNPTGRDLHVDARDGDAQDVESGVQSIELRIDKDGDGDTNDENEREALKEQACPETEDNCPLELDYSLPPDFADGAHKARVITTDRAGNVDNKSWTFYVVNLLPGSRSRLGLEDWWQFDSTDAGGDSRVHVNAETGNLVWHSVPIVNPGRGLSTFVNLTYNSLDRGGVLGSTVGRVPLVDASGLNMSQELPGLSYAEAGVGFSISVSGPTRINEPLGGVELAQLKTHLKRTGEVGTQQDWETYLQEELNIPVSSATPLGDQITLTDADGTVHTFQRGDDGKWIDPAGLDMHLREWQDGPTQLPSIPASRATPVEKKWAITRSDGTTHFFDSLGYLRETKDRNGNRLRYEYERYNALNGQTEEIPGVSLCDAKPIGELIDGVYCVMRLKRVIDPAGVEAEPGQGGAPNRTLTIDYQSGGLLPPLRQPDGTEVPQLPMQSPIPFPGLLGGKAGRIAKITDHAGEETTFAYDEEGLLVRLTEAANRPQRRVTKFEWEQKEEGLLNDPEDDIDDGLGQDRQLKGVVEVRDADGDGEFGEGEAETEYARTPVSYEPRSCPPTNPVCPLMPGVLREPRRADTVTTRRGFKRDYDYREDGQSREMDATAMVAEAAGGTPAETVKTTYRVDDRGRPTLTTDALGRQTALGWSHDNRVTSLIEAVGTADEAVTDMTYNDNGQLTSRTTWPGGREAPGGGARTVSLSYRDSSGLDHSTASGVDDAAGRFVSDLTAIDNPKPGTGWTFVVDERGNVTRRSDGKGVSSTATPDAFGRLTAQTDEAGNRTRFGSFHPTGEPQEVIAPRGNASGGDPAEHTWRYCYDRVGNVVRVTDPRGGPVDCGSQGDAPFSTRLSYDPFDRLTVERLPLDSRRQDPEVADFVERVSGHDRNGNVTSSRDGAGQTTSISYTRMDQPERVDAPGSSGREVTDYDYDGLDRLTRRTDPKGVGRGDGAFSTDYELDAAGQRLAEVRRGAPGDDPAALVTSYAFDARGNVVGVNDPRRNRGKDLQAAIAAARPSATPRIVSTYNDVDELVSQVENPSAVDRAEGMEAAETKYGYDANGNRTTVVDPRGADRSSRQLTAFDNQSYTASYTFDHRDQLVEERRPTSSADEASFSTTRYVRRCDGKVIAKTSPRGVEQGATDQVGDCGGRTYQVHRYFTTRYGYDENGDLDTRSVPFAPGQYGRTDAELEGWKVDYTRDAVGNPTGVRDARGNSFQNTFFDSGDLRTTGRPSWWELDWGEDDNANPDPGKRYREEDDAEVDTEVADGGPRLVERDERETNAQQRGGRREGGEERDLPSTEGVGNFGSVDPEELPDMLPRAGETSFRYDPEMRLTDILDSGRTRSIGYDPAGRVSHKKWDFRSGAAPITHSFDYDGHGNLSRSTVEAVRFVEQGGTVDVPTSFGYDGYDRRTSETTPGAASEPNGTVRDEVTKFTYDANGNLDHRETPRGTATSTSDDYTFDFNYDSRDRLISEANPAGDRWSYGHDLAGNVTRETSPRGNAGETAPDGESFDTAHVFDAADRLRKTTDGLGQQTTFSYDADSNRTRVEAPGASTKPGGGEVERVTERVYDGRGLPWKETIGTDDGNGDTGGDRRTTVREFDANGNLRRVVNPKGVGADGNPNNLDDGTSGANPDTSDNIRRASEHATVRVYDDDNLLTHEYLPWGNKTIDRPEGTPDDEQDKQRYKQRFDRDSRGRVRNLFAAHPVGGEQAPQVSYTYFDTDWVASSSDQQVEDPDSGRVIYSQLVRYDYDERGVQSLWRTKNADEDSRGREVRRRFYPNGTLRSREAEKVKEDGSGDETTTRRYFYFYNENRSLVRMEDNDPGRTSNPERATGFIRDAAERETRVNELWPKGKDTTFSYNAGGNVTERRTDGRYNTTTGRYEDSDGGRDDAKTTRFSYDTLDRETRMVVDQGGVHRETTRTYWPSGDLREKTRQRRDADDDDYVTEEWFYSPHGERSFKRKQRHGASDARTDQEYSYDLNGNRTKDERGSHDFNSRDQLVHWRRAKKKPGTEVFYELNASGATTRKIDTAEPAGKRTTTYKYNGSRLVSSEDEESRSAYSYDDFGNVVRIETEIKVANTVLPPVNQLPSPPQTCGELDVEKKVTRYCYDEFERLVAAKGPGLKADENAVYSYDGLDRRDTKEVRSATGSRIRDYGYVGTSKMLSREQDAGGDTKYYDYSAGGEREGQATARQGTDPSSYRSYAKDANGSVTELENGDGSNTDEEGKPNEYVYDPYGELDRAGAPSTEPDPEDQLGKEAKDNPFRYEGFYYDSGVKTYDMGARQYRPESGRFLTQDRYEQAQGDLELQADPLTQNRYAFAGGNPVSNIEFDGHFHCAAAFSSCHRGNVFYDGGRGHRGAPRPRRPEPRSNGFRSWGGRGAGRAYSSVRVRTRARRESYRRQIQRVLGAPAGLDEAFPLAGGVSRRDRRIARLQMKVLETYQVEAWDDYQRAKDVLRSTRESMSVGDVLKAVTVDTSNPLDVFLTTVAVGAAPFSGGGSLVLKAGSKMGTVAKGAKVSRVGAAAAKLRRTAFASLDAASARLNHLAYRMNVLRSCAGNSFTGDTPVRMADGTTKPISKVRVGDLVIAADPRTGKTAARRVTRLITGSGVKDLTVVTVAGQRIVATDGHPIYLVNQGRFVDASKLRVGDVLLDDQGHAVRVDRVAATKRTLTVYNLAVQGLHTYYAGAWPLLVHNISCRVRFDKSGRVVSPSRPDYGTEIGDAGQALRRAGELDDRLSLGRQGSRRALGRESTANTIHQLLRSFEHMDF